MYETGEDPDLADLVDLPPRVISMVRKNWKRYARVAELVEESGARTGRVPDCSIRLRVPGRGEAFADTGLPGRRLRAICGREQHRSATALACHNYRTELGPGDIYNVGLLVDVVEHLAGSSTYFPGCRQASYGRSTAGSLDAQTCFASKCTELRDATYGASDGG